MRTLACSTRQYHFRMWSNFIIGAAAYPLFAGGYIHQTTAITTSWQSVVVESVVAIVFILRLFRFNILAKFSTALTIMSVVPSLIFMLVALPHIDPGAWISTVGKQNCTQSVDGSLTVCDSVRSDYVFWKKADFRS
jgi:amino acid transporter